VDAVTVQAVVVRARASVGSFYARFSGKEELLHHLQATVEGDVRAWWSEALETPGWDDLSLEEAVARSVHLLRDARTVCAGERSALRGTPEGDAAERRQRELVRRWLSDRILVRAGDVRHPYPGRAIDLALRAVCGVLDDPTLEDQSGPAPVQELTRLVLSYLGAAAIADDGSPAGGVDFFDVWG
jgi:AcrR family transcriptional regulator